MPRIFRTFLHLLKRIPLFARIDWKLYLLRDWWSTRVWTRTVQVDTPLGFKLTAKAHPAYHLMRIGQFEPDESRIFNHVLDIADIFVDIGANVGYYCCLALRKGKPVIAFEPQQQNLDCLYQNMIANGWEGQIEVFPLALSTKSELLPLFGASGPSASLIKGWAGYSSRYSQLVPTNTLDNILSERFQNNQLIIKIDVEGAEYQVLNGALRTISRVPRPVWMIEVCFTEYHPGGSNPDYLKIFQLFWDHGYVCYGADSHCTPVDHDDVMHWIGNGVRELGTFNYVFADPGVYLPGPDPAS